MTSDPKHPNKPPISTESDTQPDEPTLEDAPIPESVFGPIPPAIKAMSTAELREALQEPDKISDRDTRRAIFGEYSTRFFDNPLDPEFMPGGPEKFLRSLVGHLEAGTTRNPIQDEIDHETVERSRGAPAPSRPRRKRKKPTLEPKR